MPSIEIENLVAQYDDQIALDRVSLKIEEGELFFLVGPSGCGKTTLLRHIAGFLRPLSGTIRFDAQCVNDIPSHRRETAMMFQSYALWPHMTVAENVAFGLEERKLARKDITLRVTEALRMVQLDGFETRKIGELSGGQQQRVALARALVVRPKCLLLDEPLSNLDARLRQGMREEIRRICKANHLTAVYVTHDQEEALSMADRLAVMGQGRVLQVGTPDAVYRRPAERRVAEFMGETNLLPVEILGTGHDEKNLRVGWPAGEIEVAVPLSWTGPLSQGQRAWLSIRPEAFRLGPPPMGVHRFVGVVIGAAYQGATVVYRVRISGDAEFKILSLNTAGSLHAEGETLDLWVARDDLVLLSQ